MRPVLSHAFATLLLLLPTADALAGTVLQFPQDAPAFAFEAPDDMQAVYQPDGTLALTPKDGSSLKGVFQALPNVSNDKGAAMGLNSLIKLMGPRFLTGPIQYPTTFNEDTPSGIHTITASAFGQRDGKQYGLAFIVFSKSGKYYELIVSGAVEAMTAFNFPHSFRQTMKLTP